MTVGCCVGCGAPLAPNKARGRQRKWCGDACRKRQYSPPCVDCGHLLSGSDGRGPNAPVRCRACNAARQRRDSERWILESFREWAQMFGRPPTAPEWNASAEHGGRPWPSATNVINHFGSWSAGLRAAGFEPRPVGVKLDGRYWPRERIIEAIRAWAAEHGSPPTVSLWRTAGETRPAVATVVYHFGSWNAAIRAAGLEPRSGRPRKRQT